MTRLEDKLEEIADEIMGSDNEELIESFLRFIRKLLKSCIKAVEDDE